MCETLRRSQPRSTRWTAAAAQRGETNGWRFNTRLAEILYAAEVGATESVVEPSDVKHRAAK